MRHLEQIQLFLSQNQKEMNNYLDLLYTIGNEVRFRMLYAIFKQDRVIKDISISMNMSTAAVSQHLQKLRQLNLIQCKSEKKVLHYSIHPENAKLLGILFKEFDKRVNPDI